MVDLDFDNPTGSSFEAEIDATRLWTGEPERDAHLRSADFFDVEHHLRITFKSSGVKQVGSVLSKVTGDPTIRGVTRPVTLDAQYLGQWETPYWGTASTKVSCTGSGSRPPPGSTATTSM